jgi:UDP:flavonoid glycosyltransferase YjiC (YdhE family)
VLLIALTLLRRILAASAILEARVLVTFGPSLEPGQFDAPPNARIERFIPRSAVLPHAAVMVTQRGRYHVTFRQCAPEKRGSA